MNKKYYEMIETLKLQYGRLFHLDGEKYVLQNHNVEGNVLYIVTDKKWFKMRLHEADEFLKKLHFIDIVSEETKPNAREKTFKTLEEFIGLTLQNIQDVKANPEFVNQGKVINQSLTNIINLYATQLEAVKVFGEINDQKKLIE